MQFLQRKQMRKGYILLHRQGIAAEEWKHPRRTLAWIDLLTLVDYKTCTVTASYGFLATRWRVSKNTAHLWIQHWITERQIERLAERDTERNAERFFVVNYAEYQQPTERFAERGTERVTERFTEQKKQVSSIKLEESSKGVGADAPREKAEKFFAKDATVMKAEAEYFVEKGVPVEIVRDQFSRFCHYWTELNPTGRKQLWQMKPTFELRRRLVTWFDRAAQDYKKKGGSLTMPDFRSPQPHE